MNYESSAEMTAITQQIGLKREGLVADELFPQIETGSKFGYIDWTKSLKDLRPAQQDAVTCKTDAREADFGGLELKYGGTQDRALMTLLDECGLVVCGRPQIKTEVERKKAIALMNTILLGREKRAISLSTDVGHYTDGTSNPIDSASTTDVDGYRFSVTKANVADPNYDLPAFFQAINEKTKYAPRNKMIAGRDALNKLARHVGFIGRGCVQEPKTTYQAVGDFLGVDKVVVADGKYNNGIGNNVQLAQTWPADTILFVTSNELITSEDEQFAFGFSAFSQLFKPTYFLDPKKGKGAGATYLKIGHDLTETVLSYKAATLVKIV